MTRDRYAAVDDFVAESTFSIITADAREQQVRVRISRPIKRQDEYGLEVWDSWLFVEPGLPRPLNPITGLTSLDVIAKALFTCKTILVSELKAKKLRDPAIAPFEPKKKGIVTFGEFFHDWDADAV